MVVFYAGPEGVGVLGQFMAIANVVSVIAGGGLTLGVIKYAAEYTHLSKHLYPFLSTAFCFTLLCSCFVIGFMLFFSPYFSQVFLGGTGYIAQFQWLMLAQFFTVINLFMTSILTGVGKINSLVLINILGSIAGFITIAVFTSYFQLKGALLGFIISQGIIFLIALGIVFREHWFRCLFSFRIKKKQFNKLLHYSLMTILSTLTVPLSQVFVREDIHALYGWDYVGIWQSVLRLSDAFLVFVTTVLMTYYLPKLSQLEDMIFLKKEIRRVQKTLLPLISRYAIHYIYFTRFHSNSTL